MFDFQPGCCMKLNCNLPSLIVVTQQSLRSKLRSRMSVFSTSASRGHQKQDVMLILTSSCSWAFLCQDLKQSWWSLASFFTSLLISNKMDELLKCWLCGNQQLKYAFLLPVFVLNQSRSSAAFSSDYGFCFESFGAKFSVVTVVTETWTCAICWGSLA